MSEIKSYHPAWEFFLQDHKPALQTEEHELLTTGQILDRLNLIIDHELTTEHELFLNLKEACFNTFKPAPAGLCLWMVKSA